MRPEHWGPWTSDRSGTISTTTREWTHRIWRTPGSGNNAWPVGFPEFGSPFWAQRTFQPVKYPLVGRLLSPGEEPTNYGTETGQGNWRTSRDSIQTNQPIGLCIAIRLLVFDIPPELYYKWYHVIRTNYQNPNPKPWRALIPQISWICPNKVIAREKWTKFCAHLYRNDETRWESY